MTALFAIITFLFIFVLAYLAISVTIALAAWWMIRWARQRNSAENLQKIEQKIDRLKERAFLIAIILSFFIVTPFVVIGLFVQPG